MVRIEIRSTFNGAIIAHKVCAFYRGIIRDELANIRRYCRHNALEDVVIAFNHHSRPVNF